MRSAIYLFLKIIGQEKSVIYNRPSKWFFYPWYTQGSIFSDPCIDNGQGVNCTCNNGVEKCETVVFIESLSEVI
jgi:hypothetical protein